jgi:hypothetical protein
MDAKEMMMAMTVALWNIMVFAISFIFILVLMLVQYGIPFILSSALLFRFLPAWLPWLPDIVAGIVAMAVFAALFAVCTLAVERCSHIDFGNWMIEPKIP